MKALLTAGATGIAAVAVMGVLPAATASATPWCTGSKVVQNMIMPVNGSSTNCELGTFVGSSEPSAVKTLQGAMNVCFGKAVLGSVYPLVVDGSFGPRTKLALERVQAKIGVAQDGEYGPQTRSQMRWENADSGTPCLFDGGA
jgi:peptidoglycan hydrolase-like protein with peptidoglycan-binding domain